MATLIDSGGQYVAASPYALTNAAAVNDVLVVIITSNSNTHATATVSGATATLAERQFVTNGGSQCVTVLTGLVTGAGTPSITFSGGADLSIQVWLVRGLSSATEDKLGSVTGTGNPLTTSVTTTVTTSLFTCWYSAVGDNFTSWNGSITASNEFTSCSSAYGYQLDIAAASRTDGANVTSNVNNTITQIYLPNDTGTQNQLFYYKA